MLANTKLLELVNCKMQVVFSKGDGTRETSLIEAFCSMRRVPVDLDTKANDASLPAPSPNAIELTGLVQKVIVDTGSKRKLIGMREASGAPEAIILMRAEEFFEANGLVWADTAREAKVSLMGNRGYHSHIVLKFPCRNFSWF